MSRMTNRVPVLETVLWVAASLLAFIAFLLFAPGFFKASAENPQPARATVIAADQPRPTFTPLAQVTAVPAFAPAPKLSTPVPLPLPSGKAEVFSITADPAQSGWVRNSETQPHWGERNMNVGAYKGQIYQGLLYFDLSSLAPGTKIQFADIELVGMDRTRLGPLGTWSLQLLKPDLNSKWLTLSSADLAKAPVLGQVGATLQPEDLAVNNMNQFIFGRDQLSLLEGLVNGAGIVTFRLDGPNGARDSLFTWDTGGVDTRAGVHPVLNIVAVPGQFVSVTNTPTPQNIVTAAAQAQTLQAQIGKFGTPTPFPRNYATATPFVAVTAQPTPMNQQTVAAVNAIATAVAQTTGTYTPTPPNWAVVTATPTPIYIPLGTLTPFATPTPVPAPQQQLQTPVPNDAKGNILFISDHFGTKMPLMMSPDGKLLQALSGVDVYNAAHARDMFSPDRSKQLVLTNDNASQLQIWIQDLHYGSLTPVTNLVSGRGALAYDPAWSPDGSKIVYADSEFGPTEIMVYDIATRTTRRLTTSPAGVYNQRPTWSPDSRQIAFKSNLSGIWQIWVINADGSNMHNVSNSPYNDIDPVWVK